MSNPRALPARPPLAGRTEDACTLAGLVGEARVATVTGPGGVGKSALARDFAAAWSDSGGTGLTGGTVRTVALSAVQEPAAVPYAVTRALGLPGPGPADGNGPLAPLSAAAEALGAAERGGGVLLVLDDCEHLAGAVAETAAVLTERCPRLRVVATSRVPLRVPGERTLPLAPLHRESALQLMIRLRRADGALLTPAVLDGVRRLCRLVDHLPLGLVLVARRLRTVPAPRLADDLALPGAVLGLAAPEESAEHEVLRHRTLRATVEWSHRLCSAGERVLWGRLARRGGVLDLPAAVEAAAGPGLPEWAVGRAFDGLARCSVLLPVAGTGNTGLYRMPPLHRVFGRERRSSPGAA